MFLEIREKVLPPHLRVFDGEWLLSTSARRLTGNAGWSTLAKGRVKTRPPQFAMALGIQAKSQLVSVTRARLTEWWEPTARPHDPFAKQSCQPKRIQRVLLAGAAGKFDCPPSVFRFHCIGVERWRWKPSMPPTLKSPFSRDH